jgi:tagatose 1,6-diphosphate aldolase
MDEKSLEYAIKKPEIVKAYMREFTKPQYGVDVLKLEVPINMKFVEGTKSFKGQKAYTRDEAMNHFRESAKCTNLPFIYLSAGVSNAEFSETLDLVAQSGVKYNGVLCGRATWADGVPIYAEKGLKAFEEWLNNEGVKNIQNVNKSLEHASSWHSIYGVAETVGAR